MNLISQETAERIWDCYREIKTAEKLLGDMEKLRNEYRGDPYAQRIKDAFGRGRNLQLGIPSGENGHRLIDVNPKLAESIIRAHISIKKAELIEANEKARIELSSISKLTVICRPPAS